MTPKILIVDDHDYDRLIYREWLAPIPGVQVVEATSASHALELAQRDEYALCVVGVSLDGSSGFELIERLREIPHLRATPVILVSSEGSGRRFIHQGYASGAADVVASATTRGSTLAQKARVFLELYRERVELARRVHELERRVEEYDRKHDELRTQAMHDALTKLPNRVLFRDRLRAACARAHRNRALFAVAYLDLDDFKVVNDRHGHVVGDQLLAAVGVRLSQATRATDTVARLGGDEFGVLLEALDGAGTAERLARKIHRILAQPYELQVPSHAEKILVACSCSIGLAMYPDHATDIDRLIFRADTAMYDAKHNGDGVTLYGDHLGREAPRRRPLPEWRADGARERSARPARN